MGAKGDHSTPKRHSKRPEALTSEDVSSPSAKISGLTTRVSKKRRGRKQRRLYPESVPPGMVHEVFDVSDAADIPGTLADGKPAPSRRGVPSWSKPPPAPPRPSQRPGDDAEELDADELEEDELDEESDVAVRGERLLTPPAVETSRVVARPRSPVVALLLLGGAVALALGVVLGGRDRSEASKSHTTQARKPPPVVATAASDRILIPLPDPAPNVELPSEPPADLPSAVASVSTSGDEPGSNASVAWAPPAAAEPAAPFDAEAANAAISAAFARAAACRTSTDPEGEAVATITYAPSGRVTSATVSGIFAGTSVGGCIAATLRAARVAPFSGDYVVVRRTKTLQ